MIIRNVRSVLLWFLSSAALMIVHSGDARTYLQRVFHHVGDAGSSPEQSKRLEFGQVVFYFDQEPLVSKGRKGTHGEMEQIELFFPDTQLKDMKGAKGIRQYANTYAVSLEQTAAGVKCVISFNAQRVMFEYDSFLSISSQPAVRLHFFNKSLLNLMKRSGTLLRMTSLERKPYVVIDCGHGGRDQGARSMHGIYEKDVTLSVGLEVARLLKQRGFDVCMTRRGDEDVGLDERTSRANTSGAAILVSIHANASKQSKARGVETFFLNSALFARLSDAPVWYDMVMKHHDEILYANGRHLAQCLHNGVLDVMRGTEKLSDRKVKAAASQILVGSQIPAALIEIGFLSHPQESQLLADKRYQQLLASGISAGIMNYYRQCVHQDSAAS